MEAGLAASLTCLKNACVGKTNIITISSHPHTQIPCRTLHDVPLEARQYDVISYTKPIASEGRNVFQLDKFMPISKFQKALRTAGLSLPVTSNATGEELILQVRLVRSISSR